MTEVEKRKGLAPRYTVALVVALFVVPILVASWLALVSPPGGGSLLNRGTLIEPPLDVNADPVTAALAAIPLAPGEWAMIHYGPGPCAEACERAVGTLETIRSVLGHDGTRVRIAAVVDAPGGAAHRVIVDPAARARLAAAVAAGGASDGAEQGVVFLDWRGQVMMHFADAGEPGDIKRDLKRLLRASKIK